MKTSIDEFLDLGLDPDKVRYGWQSVNVSSDVEQLEWSDVLPRLGNACLVSYLLTKYGYGKVKELIFSLCILKKNVWRYSYDTRDSILKFLNNPWYVTAKIGDARKVKFTNTDKLVEASKVGWVVNKLAQKELDNEKLDYVELVMILNTLKETFSKTGYKAFYKKILETFKLC